MAVIGITGPSGAGKGAVSAILREKYGFEIIDADSIYHSLISSPSPCLEEIRHNFGDAVIGENSVLDRKALSSLVFGKDNHDRLVLLNKITHKYVVEKILSEIERCKSNDIHCVVDAPLLIEAGLRQYCDFTLAILASEHVRVARIVARDNISPEQAMIRISSQKGDEYYLSNTDCSINNDGELPLLESSLENILSERRVTK